jgi:hypothetical protein
MAQGGQSQNSKARVPKSPYDQGSGGGSGGGQGGGSGSQGGQQGQPKYPYNQVYVSEAGHEVHFDNTPGEERIFIGHKAGTYMEIGKDGSMKTFAVGQNFQYNKGGMTMTVNQNHDMKVSGHHRFNVDGGSHIEVAGDSNMVTAGHSQSVVGGTQRSATAGNIYQGTKGNIMMNATGNMQLKVKGNIDMETKGGKFNLQGDVKINRIKQVGD